MFNYSKQCQTNIHKINQLIKYQALKIKIIINFIFIIYLFYFLVCMYIEKSITNNFSINKIKTQNNQNSLIINIALKIKINENKDCIN